jgi:hypothetical protein
MIANHIIQADFVADLKAYAALTTLLDSASEVREAQYQGTVFFFPAVRVSLDSQTYYEERDQCDHTSLTFSVYAYAEDASSRLADLIAGVVNERLHRRYLRGTGYNIPRIRSRGLISAVREGEHIWRAEAIFEGHIYPTA